MPSLATGAGPSLAPKVNLHNVLNIVLFTLVFGNAGKGCWSVCSSTGFLDSASVLVFDLPARYWMSRSNSWRVIPHQASFPDECEVFSRDFRA